MPVPRIHGERVPRVDERDAAGPQHAPQLAHRARLVGHEHQAELAHDRVDIGVGQRQRLRVGGAPRDARVVDHAARVVDHRRVEIGRDQLAVRRQPRDEVPGNAPGARRNLEHASRTVGHAPREVARVRLEEHRPVEAVVELGHGADERGRRAHSSPSSTGHLLVATQWPCMSSEPLQ